MPIRLRRPKQLHPWLKKEELALGDTYTHTQKKSAFVSKLDTRPPQHFSLSTGRLDGISLLIQWNSGLIFWLSWHHPASLRSICLLSLSLTSHWKLETCRGRNWLCALWFFGFLGALKWKGNGILALSCNFVFLLRFYWQFVIVFIRLKREGAFNIHFQFLWPKFYPKWCLYFGLKKKKSPRETEVVNLSQTCLYHGSLQLLVRKHLPSLLFQLQKLNQFLHAYACSEERGS